jgi:hypothetical protein
MYCAKCLHLPWRPARRASYRGLKFRRFTKSSTAKNHSASITSFNGEGESAFTILTHYAPECARELFSNCDVRNPEMSR